MAKVILLTGPSGAGKTTTAEMFLKSAPGVWAYISQDELRQLVVAGYASADDYSYNWGDETRRQWEVSIPICTDIVRRYNYVGINCIVDFFAPPEEFEKWRRGLVGIDYKLFVLLPSIEETVARNAGRSARSQLKENKIRQNHALFQAWADSREAVTVIDTSEIKISETVAHIRCTI